MAQNNPDELELAALLCSRVCHDIISPVGAITNGLEVLDEDDDEQMRGFAMDLIRKSAAQASAKLQFARLAFGAAGSAGAQLDLADAASVAINFVNDGKTTLNWEAQPVAMGKDYVKILLNMILIAQQAVPRGGSIDVEVINQQPAPDFTMRCSGFGARIPSGAPELIAGDVGEGNVDARSIQPYYLGMVARSAGMELSLNEDGGDILIRATS